MLVSVFRERKLTSKSRLSKRKREKEEGGERRWNFNAARKRTIFAITFFRHIAQRTFQDVILPNFLFAREFVTPTGKISPTS